MTETTSPAEIIIPLVFFVVFIALAFILQYYYVERSKTMLERWANEQRLRLLASEQRWWRAGPYFWNRSRGQVVYYVEAVPLENPLAFPRRGYVRLGSFWWGIWQYAADVTWES